MSRYDMHRIFFFNFSWTQNQNEKVNESVIMHSWSKNKRTNEPNVWPSSFLWCIISKIFDDVHQHLNICWWNCHLISLCFAHYVLLLVCINIKYLSRGTLESNIKIFLFSLADREMTAVDSDGIAKKEETRKEKENQPYVNNTTRAMLKIS